MQGRPDSSESQSREPVGDNSGQKVLLIVVAIELAALGFGMALGWGLHAASAAPTSVTTPVTVNASESLPDQKLRADIQLEQAQRLEAIQQAAASQAANRWWRQVVTPGASVLAAAITGLVAYLAIMLPLRRQHEQDRKQRVDAAAQEVKERAKDRIQRFDEGFGSTVNALGNDNESIQAGGAAALQGYLRPDMHEFLDQVYLVVRANLDEQIPHQEPVRRLLVAALGKALKQSLPRPDAEASPRIHSFGRGDGPDLLRKAWIRGADLRDLDLSSADIAFSQLQHARLDGASMRRCRGMRVHLDNATLRSADLEEARLRGASAPRAVFDAAVLVSVRLEDADLTGARFRAAQLQSAHFQGAVLEQADFRDADVRDTFFHNATFDDDALGTLLLTSTWRALSSRAASGEARAEAERQARTSLDEDTADRLLVLARRRLSGTRSAP